MVHGVSAGPLLINTAPRNILGGHCEHVCGEYHASLTQSSLNWDLGEGSEDTLQNPDALLILLCCLIGAYATNNNAVDVIIMIIFGIVGYFLRKHEYELAPIILALVLGPLLETNFRNALIIGDGRLTIFFEKPISAVLLSISASLFLSTGFSNYRKTKKKIVEEVGDVD